MSANDESDYYSLLSVPRNCSQEDVKKAYKRCALRWHPDKNPTNKTAAERQFKLISEAYEVLCDPKKRQIYDMYGKKGLLSHAQTEANSARHQRSNGAHSATWQTTFGDDSDPIFRMFFRDPFELFREIFGGPTPSSAGHNSGPDLLFNPFQMFGGVGGGVHPFASLIDQANLMTSSAVFEPPFTLDLSTRSAGLHHVHSAGSMPLFPRAHQLHHHQQQQPTLFAPHLQQSRHSQPGQQHQLVMSTGHSPFGGLDSLFAGLGGMGAAGGTHFSFSSSGFGGPAASSGMQQRSVSTQIINGRSITTQREVCNGTETVTVLENGRVLSCTVNGQPVQVN